MFCVFCPSLRFAFGAGGRGGRKKGEGGTSGWFHEREMKKHFLGLVGSAA